MIAMRYLQQSVRLLGTVCLLSLAGVAAGQDQTPAQGTERFTGGYWAQFYPNRDFDRGCVVGYLAFEFSPTGYFIFNRKITGSWQIDAQGNLRLKTRQGQRIALTVENDLLRPTTDTGLIKRANLYKKCPQ